MTNGVSSCFLKGGGTRSHPPFSSEIFHYKYIIIYIIKYIIIYIYTYKPSIYGNTHMVIVGFEGFSPFTHSNILWMVAYGCEILHHQKDGKTPIIHGINMDKSRFSTGAGFRNHPHVWREMDMTNTACSCASSVLPRSSATKGGTAPSNAEGAESCGGARCSVVHFWGKSKLTWGGNYVINCHLICLCHYNSLPLIVLF